MVELFTQSPTVFIGVAFAFALMIGSFLNVVIYRLPIMMQREWREQCDELLSTPAPDLPEGHFNLVVPRSRCPACGKEIKAWQNIPVLSYLLLGAQCANCQASISVRYPLVETFTAVAAAVCAWHFGFGWEALLAIGLSCVLIAISLIDVDHQIIPDSIVIPLLWVGLVMSLLHPLAGAETLFIAPQDAIIGALAGYLSLWSVYQLFKLVTGKEGMGYGDFKLLAALGAWLGWQALPTIILLSAIVGAVIGIAMIVFRGRDRQLPIPYGPYLAAAGWITMLYGETIKNTYLDMFL
ncbi:MAG: A24 family peptidase [Gammaproteobacteria bacterium]|jgi:leader peptidase (prepilin peptidase)/N-methyltransferase|nr:A24 family peptidase [Gammaproteobacteria bacterium]MDH3757423.1 A24 family peptidase [Gammaproteobacteria bacterium]MDH3805648.1 A24 family peptidase [Gammaproteobacteria bacterium]